MKPAFGHPPATLAFWRRLARRALAAKTSTPCYLFSVEPMRAALAELEALDFGAPVTHWLSCKTQPFAPLLRWWRAQGRPIEVVSEFEFLAARRAGFATEQILINGPAKHRWLPRHARRGLRVNFDSRAELDALLPLAVKLDWSVGVRVHTREEFDPENPKFPTQFGFAFDEAGAALRRLRRAKARVETIHFHLRTNVASPAIYQRALDEVAAVCRRAKFAPRHLDCGGGLPPRHALTRDGKAFDVAMRLPALAAMYRRALKQFPGLRELWLENGRFLLAGSGALLVRVLDVKERRGLRQLLCDGGRTMNALVSNWEQHELLALPARGGRRALTAVHGPTCMAFDQLARCSLPAALRAGDHLLWLEAGAYHLPWETRFSHGLAAAWWHEDDMLALARPAEGFEAWWNQWR
jgi:diaminopimelate decarboxylase